MHLTATESKFRRHSGARIWDRGGSGFSVWAVFFRQGRARILQTAVFFFLIFFRQNLIFRGWLKVRKGRALTLQTAFFCTVLEADWHGCCTCWLVSEGSEVCPHLTQRDLKKPLWVKCRSVTHASRSRSVATPAGRQGVPPPVPALRRTSPPKPGAGHHAALTVRTRVKPSVCALYSAAWHPMPVWVVLLSSPGNSGGNHVAARCPTQLGRFARRRHSVLPPTRTPGAQIAGIKKPARL